MTLDGFRSPRISFGAWAFGAFCIFAAGQAQAAASINLTGKAVIVTIDGQMCVDATVGSNRVKNCNGTYHEKERLRFVGNKVLVDTLEQTDSGNLFAGATRGLNTGSIFVIGETFDVRQRPDLPSSFRPAPGWDIKRAVVSARARGRTLDLAGDIRALKEIQLKGLAYEADVQMRTAASLALNADSCSVSSQRTTIALVLAPAVSTAKSGKVDISFQPTSASCSIENGG
jgi:hypothetical protein